VLLADTDADRAAGISEMLGRRLPPSFLGYPTAFGESGTPAGPDRHWVDIAGLGPWLTGRLGFDPRRGLTLADWLAVPTQQLAEVTGGAVFHDGLRPGAGSAGPAAQSRPADTGRAGQRGPGGGALGQVRAALAWYPRDVWLYVLASQWQRIGQEEAFPGRCAEAGDELGSAVVTARLVRDLVRLALLMQRRYPPYSKWLGTALARLPAAAPLVRSLTAAVSAATWPERERAMCAAYETAARMHNQLGVTAPLDTATRQFYDRPIQVADAGRFADALRNAIGDREVRRLPPTGAVDQFVDSTDALGDMALMRGVVATRLRGRAGAPR
jgi:hypothetical protein